MRDRKDLWRPNPRAGAQQSCCQDMDTLDEWEEGAASAEAFLSTTHLS